MAGIVAAGVIAGCRRGGDADVLEFWAMGREGEVVQRLVPEFERRHPGARVRVQQIPWSAAHEKLLTAYVGGAMPDVVQVGNTWLAELAALGALAPVEDALAVRDDALAARDDARASVAADLAAGSDEFPGVVAATAIDGERFGVPWYVDTRVLFYRRDLLRAAGVDAPPATWDGWVAAMERLARGGERYAVLLPMTEWEPPVIFAMQRGATLLRDGDRFGDFRSPAFRAALDFYRSLFQRGLAPRAGAARSANVYQDFASGWFSILISGPWNLGEMTRRLPALADAWATAPLPTFAGEGPGVSLAGGASLAVVRTSPHAELAWRWIAFLAEPAQQLAFWRLTGDLPARPSAWREAGLADAPRTAAFWRQLARVQAPPTVPEWERIAAKITEHAEDVVRGAVALDDALTALDRDVDAMLEKRRWMLDRAAARGAAAAPVRGRTAAAGDASARARPGPAGDPVGGGRS
ncbi:MAG: sugar ABC transporter substrate-binding protein [Deltaproteobacteria bacterium]|nr:sugar ABC transporter substrate-binding protein [Deltaproteobacteria bacterium]